LKTPIILAIKNVAFKISSGLSFLTIATVNHDSEPIKNKIYPNWNKWKATKKEPIIEVRVPIHEILFIIF
jgi:hypothetical protein